MAMGCVCPLCRPLDAVRHFIKPCGHAPDLLCGCGVRLTTDTEFTLAWPPDGKDAYRGRHRKPATEIVAKALRDSRPGMEV